jgi:hypothetical protein
MTGPARAIVSDVCLLAMFPVSRGSPEEGHSLPGLLQYTLGTITMAKMSKTLGRLPYL